MVYMSADNDLERHAIAKIENQLAVIGSSEPVSCMVLLDRGSRFSRKHGDWTGTKLFKIVRNLKATSENALEDWGNRNMGDKQTLIDFVSESKRRSPAKKYALFFFGKGYSFHPGVSLYDSTSADSLDMDEIKDALPSLGAIDFVGYDASWMGSVEVASLWHGHASAVAFSETEVGGDDGISFDSVLLKLNLDPAMVATELAVVVSEGAVSAQSFSSVALDERFDALLLALNKWSSALMRGLSARPVQTHHVQHTTFATVPHVSTNRDKFDHSFASTSAFGGERVDKDLVDMANKIRAPGIREPYGVEDGNIKATCKGVVDAVSRAVMHSRRAEGVTAHGLLLYQIACAASTISRDAMFYSQLDFSAETNWAEFLSLYAISGDGCTEKH